MAETSFHLCVVPRFIENVDNYGIRAEIMRFCALLPVPKTHSLNPKPQTVHANPAVLLLLLAFLLLLLLLILLLFLLLLLLWILLLLLPLLLLISAVVVLVVIVVIGAYDYCYDCWYLCKYY